MLRSVLAVLLAFAVPALAAIDPALVKKLATGDSDGKVEAIGQIVATGDPDAFALLKSMADGELQHEGEEVMVNNRVRRELESALAALKLMAPERSQRADAIKELASGADESLLPLVKKALAKETDPDLKAAARDARGDPRDQGR